MCYHGDVSLKSGRLTGWSEKKGAERGLFFVLWESGIKIALLLLVVLLDYLDSSWGALEVAKC